MTISQEQFNLLATKDDLKRVERKIDDLINKCKLINSLVDANN